MLLSGCFGNPGVPETTSASSSESVTEAAAAVTEITTELTTADTEGSAPEPSAAVLANEDEPQPVKEPQPLTVAVTGVRDSYSPFDEPDEFTELLNKMTGVTLAGRTRSGNPVLSGISGVTEQYAGTSYSYSGIADTVIAKDPENDTTTYSIRLRSGVRFADGEPMTADDVIFTLYLHLDPSYKGSYPLENAGIVGTLSYRYNTSAADSITPEQLEAALATDEVKAAINEKIVIPVLKEQYENVKSMYGDSAYSVYTSRYPSAPELFAFFYALNVKDGKEGEAEKYSAKGKNEQTVIAEVAEMYDGNYRKLAGMTVGNETAFDEQALGIAVGFITNGGGGDLTAGAVKAVGGIAKTGTDSLTVTVKGDCTEFENALYGMVIVPLHHYGSIANYNYDNERFGFTSGSAADIEENTRLDPLGAGPYTVVGFGEGEVLLKANEYYYKGTVGAESAKLVEGSPEEAASLIADGAADISAFNSTEAGYDVIEEANRSIEKIYPVLSSDLGYGYVGINADNVSIGDGFSKQSYALRNALATAVSAFRDESVAEYFGGYGNTTDYPYIENLEIDENVSGYSVPYSKDVYGGSIYTAGMTDEERRSAVKSACLGYLMSAGYSMSEGVITAAPYGGRTEFNAIIAAHGTGDHPVYAALKKASELLGEIGITLNITDAEDPGMLWEALSGGTNEIWAGAWNTETLSAVYIDSYYGLESSTKLKKLIEEAESAPNSEKPASFMMCYNKIVNEYAVEIPMYRRTECTLFSSLRIDVSTIPADQTETFGWADAIDSIKLKQR